MSLIREISHLLRRPVTAPPVPPLSAGRRPRAEAVDVPLPVTEAELRGAIEAAFAERQAAERTIESVGERRTAMLLAMDGADESEDDALLAIEREAELASIRLERLDLLEPRLYAKIRELRAIQKNELFLIERDQLVKGAPAVIAALREAAIANREWMAARDRVAGLFPEALNVMPGDVDLTLADVATLERAVASFSTTIRQTGGPGFSTSAQQLVDYAKATGERPPWGTPNGEAVEAFIEGRHRVVLKFSTRDATGQPVKAGETLDLNFDEAQALVQSGRATWSEEKARN